MRVRMSSPSSQDAPLLYTCREPTGACGGVERKIRAQSCGAAGSNRSRTSASCPVDIDSTWWTVSCAMDSLGSATVAQASGNRSTIRSSSASRPSPTARAIAEAVKVLLAEYTSARSSATYGAQYCSSTGLPSWSTTRPCSSSSGRAATASTNALRVGPWGCSLPSASGCAPRRHPGRRRCVPALPGSAPHRTQQRSP